MPKEVKNLKQFVDLVKDAKKGKQAPKDAKKTVFIKKNKKVTKFKVRKGPYLYTLLVNKTEDAKKVISNLDRNGVQKIEIKKRVIKAKKNKK